MQEVIAAYIPGLANVSGTTLAVVYSLVYNGVYMIPEIILTCVVGFLLVQFAGKQVLDKPADVTAKQEATSRGHSPETRKRPDAFRRRPVLC